MKFNWLRVVLKADKVYLVHANARADLLKASYPIVSLVPNVDSLKKHSVVVATEPIETWNTSVALR